MAKQSIILSEEIIPPPALVRASLDALPAIVRARGERASRRFIEFFTARRHAQLVWRMILLFRGAPRIPRD
jgi:hypothetical protein